MKSTGVKDKNLREDHIDIAIAKDRSREKGRPFREYLAETEKKAGRRISTKKYGMRP